MAPILIKDVPVGSLVKLYASRDRIILGSNGADGEIQATVCYHNGVFHQSLLGWKNIPVCISWNVIVPSLDPEDKWMAEHGYKHGWWVSEGIQVKQVLTSISSSPHVGVSGGMSCSGKGCGTLNDYAQANTPEGLYYCYSCRQIPSCMR